jgi:hypothetical protein
MYIERVPNRNSPPAVLLREAYREGKKVRKRTLANLSKWPQPLVEGLRVLLRGGTAIGPLEEAFEIARSRPHGHVAAVLGTAKRLGLARMLAGRPSRERDLVLAMVVARILEPRSKLATARALHGETLAHSLGESLGVDDVEEAECYAAMDWLLERQGAIEQRLAKRHLNEGSVVLYDLSSTYFEGHRCPLAQRGYSRDGKRSTLQIVFGLLCNAEGCPVAVEVFEGNTADPNTVGVQLEKLRERFGLSRVVVVGDRGMLTEARLREQLKPLAGVDWVSALRAPAIAKLIDAGAVQLSLFDERNLMEITHPDYPGERLIVCRNPLLAEERRRKRTELLAATEAALTKIRVATERTSRPLRGKDKIALRVGRIINQFKVAKHFVLEITENTFRFHRDEPRIAAEAALDGLYVIRTSVPATTLDAEQSVRTYKRLGAVEQAFRSFKSVDLKIRPIFHHLAERVRAHVFLCMLAYYVEWHMRQALAPLLFDDDDRTGAEAQRADVVAPAQPSPRAQAKAACKRTEHGEPVHSFQTLLADLATIVKNRIQPNLPGAEPFDQLTRPTPLQQRALDLLQVRL